ncbi:formimidoylglutamate deiminase [Aeromicrobium sp. CTD01-1L150]|uniref:formimidoylglutamate deiminase n=1 Tax=Aeromicrobium sp. CTD01-1L150 TaxID=3341830 RepID=UPI0035C0405E
MSPVGSEVPGLANCHSHVVHRALRGRVRGAGSFWQWREQMYALTSVIDPDLLHRLARATYAEMRLAGITSVGEFHYLHHQADGAGYADPNELGEAVIAAASDVGLRICLLDTCYLTAGFGREPEGVQVRFSDGDVDAWVARATDLAARHAGRDDVVVGSAVHSVRAVPAEQVPDVVAALPDAPLHVHVSEQPRENTECLAATGLTPVALLAEAGVWSPRTTAVHATHLTYEDVAILGGSGAHVCFCPTTEAELGDGVGPSVALRDAGARLTLGSDSHTVIDLFAEARAVEMHERLTTGVRGAWTADQLWEAATATGHASLGLGPGEPVRVRGTVRTAGAEELLWAAGAADVLPPTGLDPDEVAAELETVVNDCWRRT